MNSENNKVTEIRRKLDGSVIYQLTKKGYQDKSILILATLLTIERLKKISSFFIAVCTEDKCVTIKYENTNSYIISELIDNIQSSFKNNRNENTSEHIETKICFSENEKIDFEKETLSFLLDNDDYYVRIISQVNNDKYYNEQFLILFINILENLSHVDDNFKINDIININYEQFDQIKNKFNSNECTFKQQYSILNYLEESYTKYGDNCAVESGNESITYNELKSLVNYYITGLRTRKIKAGDTVAICYEKSINMIISFLSVVSMGAVAVLIDGTLPKERLKCIYDDSKPELTVSDCKNSDFISFLHEFNCIYANNIDFVPNTMDKLINCVPDINDVSTKSIAVIIYTSGTTGKPKGIAITHQNILSSVINNYYIETYEYDRRLQVSNYVFDGFLFDTFSTLFYGACLVLMDHNDMGNPQAISRTLKRKKISKVFLITSLLNTLADLDITCFDNLNRIYFGGETASIVHTKKVFDRVGPYKLCNVYGPTETTMMSTVFDVNDINCLVYDVPIGQPIDNKSVYITDQFLNLLPANVPGEIYIGGYGVAEGYINNRQETNNRFLSKLKFESGRVYKTGDYGFIDEKGILHFIGRIDEQVKIRGFRIEISEIENAINSFKFINESCVVCINRERVSYIVCYYTSNSNFGIDNLKNYLIKKIPNYMVPNKFFKVEKFPYNSSGKIDRTKLTETFEKIDECSGKCSGITDNFEEKLVNMVYEILKVMPSDIEDSFFELGGDSLSMHLLASYITSEFKCSVTYSDIFEARSLKKIAIVIREAGKNIFKQIEQLTIRENYPMSNAQKRIFTECIKNKKNIGTAYNNIFIINIDGQIDVLKLEQSINIVFNRHRILKTNFVINDNDIVQKVVENHVICLKVENVGINDIENYLSNFSIAFSLLNNFLFRCSLLKHDSSSYSLVFDFHHTVFDGMSISVFVNEIVSSYNGFDLEKLQFDYLDYCCYEKNNTKSISKTQEDFWHNKKYIYNNNKDILFGKDMNEKHNFKGNRNRYMIYSDLDMLKNFACKNDTTAYIVLMAAYMLSSAILKNSFDVVVGTVSSGRDEYLSEKLIGVFIETIPIMFHINSEITILEYLLEVKKDILSSFKNKTELNYLHDLFECDNIINNVFEYQNLGVESINSNGILFTPTKYSLNQGVKYAILLEAFEDNEKLYLNVEYSSNIFNKEQIGCFVNCLSEVLNGMIINSCIKVRDLIEKLETLHERNILWNPKKSYQ